MGFPIEFNWALKLKPEQGLNESELYEGRIFEFSKEGYRIYPIDIPIDLINKDWEAVAKVVIREVTLKEGNTSGKYEVIEVYDKNKREERTRYWRKIVEFKKVK
jgi:hypothetical protein